MSHIVEIDEDGMLPLPAEVLEQVKPNRCFVIEVTNGTLVLRPEPGARPLWATATPEERAKEIRRWVARHKGGPGLPLEALSRETIYD